MEDQQLFKLALFTSIVGILGMMIFAGNIILSDTFLSLENYNTVR